MTTAQNTLYTYTTSHSTPPSLTISQFLSQIPTHPRSPSHVRALNSLRHAHASVRQKQKQVVKEHHSSIEQLERDQREREDIFAAHVGKTIGSLKRTDTSATTVSVNGKQGQSKAKDRLARAASVVSLRKAATSLDPIAENKGECAVEEEKEANPENEEELCQQYKLDLVAVRATFESRKKALERMCGVRLMELRLERGKLREKFADLLMKEPEDIKIADKARKSGCESSDETTFNSKGSVSSDETVVASGGGMEEVGNDEMNEINKSGVDRPQKLQSLEDELQGAEFQETEDEKTLVGLM